jgi:sulfatase maturation enzyme AslB (radical SAM superfamily)
MNTQTNLTNQNYNNIMEYYTFLEQFKKDRDLD